MEHSVSGRLCQDSTFTVNRADMEQNAADADRELIDASVLLNVLQSQAKC